MGGAQVAAGRGISSVFYNPANLGHSQGEELYLNSTQYFADISHSVIGYSRELSEFDIIGLNIFYLDSGNMYETDIEGVVNEEGEGGLFKVYNFAAQATYVRNFGERLKAGVTLKYIREDIADMGMQGLAFDVGSSYDLGLFGIVLGTSLSNIGPEVKFSGKGLEVVDSDEPSGILVTETDDFPLSSIFRLGLECQLMGSDDRAIITNDLISVLIAGDAVKPLASYLYSSIGAEVSFTNMVFVRGGVILGHDTAALSAGLGLKYKGLKFDYALSSYGDLGQTGQFGVHLNF